MKRILDHDAVTGVTTWFEHDPVADEVTIWSEQKDADIKKFLDRVQRKRNDDDATRKGIKNGFWHYATLQPLEILNLKKKGIDIFNPDHTKAMLKEINTNYPYTKATTKWHR